MKILSKLSIIMALVVIIFSSHQIASAYPEPSTILKPILINKDLQRGNIDFNAKPRPGYNVTLLMNQMVHFVWDRKATKNFVITDDKGKIIFETPIKDKRSLDIVPSNAKLKAGQKYSWSVDGKKFYAFTILDAKNEKDLLKNLAEIDAESVSQEERVIKKALYVQELSELYPDLDLYWLSAQWLIEISPPKDSKLELEQEQLLNNCSKHILLEKGKRI